MTGSLVELLTKASLDSSVTQWKYKSLVPEGEDYSERFNHWRSLNRYIVS